MSTTIRLFGAGILSFGLAVGLLRVSPAQAQSEQQVTINQATRVMADLRHDPAFGNARELMHRARAVMIVPRLVKGGFFVGGEGGGGVLMTHGAAGGWSQPAFYAIGSASFGLQIGLERSEMVMFIMSQRALDAMMTSRFKVGAGAGLAVVTLGSNVEQATTTAAGADIVLWARSQGAYAGISLNGSVIEPQYGDDHAYYGPGVTPSEILFSGRVVAPGANALVRQMDSLG